MIAHEEAHIKRKDHWIKPVGFLILSVYWFHPLLWAAYVMLCKDIELACDEKVIGALDREHRQAYSLALLNCSMKRYRIAACPLAFGEVSVKERVKGVMNYKKTGFWMVVIGLVVCVAVAVFFLTDPAEDEQLATYGEFTLRYCFTEFLKGRQTDLRGHIMAQLCQEIMPTMGEAFIIEYEHATGQEWFDAFLSSAHTLKAQYDDDTLHKYYPASRLVLDLEKVQ